MITKFLVFRLPAMYSSLELVKFILKLQNPLVFENLMFDQVYIL